MIRILQILHLQNLVRVKKTTKKSVSLFGRRCPEQQGMLYMELNVAHRIRRLKK